MQALQTFRAGYATIAQGAMTTGRGFTPLARLHLRTLSGTVATQQVASAIFQGRNQHPRNSVTITSHNRLRTSSHSVAPVKNQGLSRGLASGGGSAVDSNDPYFGLLWNRESPMVDEVQLTDVKDQNRRRAMLLRRYKDTVSSLRRRFAQEVIEQRDKESAAVLDLKSEIEARKAATRSAKEQRRERRIEWQKRLITEAEEELAEEREQKKRHFTETMMKMKSERQVVYRREKALSTGFLPVDPAALDVEIEARISDAEE